MTLPSGYDYYNRKNSSVVRSNPKIFENPIVGLDLLEIPSYEIEILEGAEDYIGLDTLDLRPIEADASILFYNRESNDEIHLPISKIKDLRIVNESDGSLFKRKELTLGIIFETESGDKTILINSNDKNIDEFIRQVNSIQKSLHDDLWWTYCTIYFKTDKNTFTAIHIYPMVPFLSSGETIVWHNLHTTGVVNKKIKQIDLVTNYRIYQYDYVDHSGNYVLMSAVEDVIVSNQRRLSDSSRYGNYVRSSYTITGHGNTKTTSQTVGDVSIVANGRPYILFGQISDPNGLARMIKSMKKQCKFITDPPIDLVKDYTVSISESKTHLEKESLGSENLVCIFCNKKNLPKSKFCNYCGQPFPISNKCKICSHVNPNDAIFCNHCGNNLMSKK